MRAACAFSFCARTSKVKVKKGTMSSWVNKVKETAEAGEEISLRFLQDYTNIFRHHKDVHTARILSRVWKVASTIASVKVLVETHRERLASLYGVLSIEEGLDNIQEHLQEAFQDFNENAAAELEEFKAHCPQQQERHPPVAPREQGEAQRLPYESFHLFGRHRDPIGGPTALNTCLRMKVFTEDEARMIIAQ
jgi:hypothetical protein